MGRGRFVLTLAFALPVIVSTGRSDLALGQTYYVDNTNVGSGCPGTGNGTSQNPYCSIAYAFSQISAPMAGKTLIVRPGTGFYREAVTIAAADSGAVQVGGVLNPFVLKAEGTVLIDGSDEVATWVNMPGTTIWQATIPPPATSLGITQVYHGGIRYPSWPIPVGGSWQDLPEDRCTYVQSEGAIYLNSGNPPPFGDPAYVSHRRPIRIRASNVTVDGFTIRRSVDDGIEVLTSALEGVRNVTIKKCDIRDCRQQGISFDNQPSHHSTISDNISCANGSSGIQLASEVTDFSVLRNTVASNADPLAAELSPPGRSSVCGIRLGVHSGTAKPYDHNHLLEGNNAFGNQDAGFDIRTNRTRSRYNQAWSNQDHGFDHSYCRDVSHAGDLAWGNNRDGMSFESTASNDTVRNCVLANNGRDRCRNDWELEVDEAAVLAGWSSSFNVIWRDPVNEASDDQIINFKGGPQLGMNDSQCDNCDNPADPMACTDGTKYFETMSAFAAHFADHAVGSVDTQPDFADSNSGNFIPLSSSSVLDAGDSYVAGYLSTDARGFQRHDAQSREPNTGTGYINYVDIGPYEFDVNEAPSAPTIAAYAGRTDMLVSWESTQFNGDESSAYELLIGGVGLVSGPTAAAGGTNCAEVHGLQDCTWYSAQVRITDVNTGMSTLSNTVNVKTRCTGMTELSCSGSGFGAPPEEARYDGDGDQPALLEDQPLSLVIHSDARRSGRVVAYGVPRALAGVPLELSVYDVAGRRMQTLVRGPSIPGRYAVPLGYGPGDTPVCGVYFVRLRVGGETLRRRVVVW